jgi:hypothetical protein
MDLVKYPKTMHLPWSPGISRDDKVLHNTDCFKGKEVVVTVKMDGENTTIYENYIHSRSIDSKNHWSRDYVKGLQGRIGYLLSYNHIRICGENLYAKHTIHYKNITSYFMVFSIWEKDTCLSWDKTVSLCESINIETVPVLYRGIWDEKLIKSLYKQNYNGDECEGYVVRLADSFNLDNFSNSIAKYVRKNHVQTDEHWLYNSTEKNILKNLQI